jgi:hypothetical protein
VQQYRSLLAKEAIKRVAAEFVRAENDEQNWQGREKHIKFLLRTRDYPFTWIGGVCGAHMYCGVHTN